MNADPQAFCGNCGAQVSSGDTSCPRCGRAVNVPPRAEHPPGLPPDDYVPYCRVGGEPLRWQDANTCRSCGISPLCFRHFDVDLGLCSDCAAAAEARYRYDEHRMGMGAGTSSAGGVEYMGFWIRLLARAVDGLVLVAIELLLLRFGAYSFAILLVITIGYYVGFTSWSGQTPGKMLVGIQVVNAGGAIPSIGQVLMREIIGKIVSTIPLLLGFFWAGWDPQKRAWHDHIAGTYVVRKTRG